MNNKGINSARIRGHIRNIKKNTKDTKMMLIDTNNGKDTVVKTLCKNELLTNIPRQSDVVITGYVESIQVTAKGKRFYETFVYIEAISIQKSEAETVFGVKGNTHKKSCDYFIEGNVEQIIEDQDSSWLRILIVDDDGIKVNLSYNLRASKNVTKIKEGDRLCCVCSINGKRYNNTIKTDVVAKDIVIRKEN